MTKRDQVYKCGLCGNMVEVIHPADGELVCCGEPMQLLGENTTDAATEKHVPVIEQTEDGVKVSVGSVLHPMEPDHYIEWIELKVGDDVLREYLAPGGEPSAVFKGVTAEGVVAREFCNKHGLWKS